MTSKFYLRNAQTNTAPSAGEKSTTQPVAASNFGTSPTTRDLLAAKGSSATTQVTASNATTSAQNGCLGRWSSRPLGAGTYGSGTWTFAIQSIEANADANMFFVEGVVYFWRPSNSTVVGFVRDTDTSVGVEFGNNTTSRYGQVLTWSGSNVTIVDGDILVIEVWVKGTQGMASTRNLTLCYDGTTDVTAAYSGTDPAAYLTAPADIPEIITGTIAVTDANDTQSSAGSPIVTGTSAVSDANDTAAVAGSPVVSATSAVTDANDTASAAGSPIITGASAVTDANDVQTSAGSPIVAGSAAELDDDDTQAATGRGPYTLAETLFWIDFDDVAAWDGTYQYPSYGTDLNDGIGGNTSWFSYGIDPTVIDGRTVAVSTDYTSIYYAPTGGAAGTWDGSPGEISVAGRILSLPVSDGLALFCPENSAAYPALVTVNLAGVHFYAVVTAYSFNGGVIRVTDAVVDTEPHVWSLVIDGPSTRLYVDGVEAGWLADAQDTSGDPYDWSTGMPLGIAQDENGSPDGGSSGYLFDEGGWDNYFPGTIFTAGDLDQAFNLPDMWVSQFGFTGLLSDTDRLTLVDLVLPTTPADAGTMAWTDDNDTFAAAGTPIVTGSCATIDANDIQSAAGTLTITASSATLDANDTQSSAGAPGVTGVAAWVDADDICAATATLRVTGTVSWTDADDVMVAHLAVTVTGTVSWTDADDVMVAELIQPQPPVYAVTPARYREPAAVGFREPATVRYREPGPVSDMEPGSSRYREPANVQGSSQ